MKVKVEYTVYKTMEIEIPKALSEAYRKAQDSDNRVAGTGAGCSLAD